jgi:hypothetical protein
MSAEAGVVRDLFLHWLRDTLGRAFRLAGEEESFVTVSDGDSSLVLAIRPLVATEDERWLVHRKAIESLIGEGLPARVALWIPAGADLPADEPAISEFAATVREAATKLGPHERSYVPLPATLLLRKTSDSGGVVSVTGGLNPFWARFTERVRGSYDLDSTQLHRLPESDEHLERLLDTVVETSATLEVGQVAPIETIDAWTLQRLSGDQGVTILGVSPGDADDLGLAVRRNLRRVLAEAAPPLRGAGTDLRGLVVSAPYARVEHEGVTTALRGYDPGSYSGIDFVCVAVDGLIKPMIQPL